MTKPRTCGTCRYCVEGLGIEAQCVAPQPAAKPFDTRVYAVEHDRDATDCQCYATKDLRLRPVQATKPNRQLFLETLAHLTAWYGPDHGAVIEAHGLLAVTDSLHEWLHGNGDLEDVWDAFSEYEAGQ
jgi:hypothetical protein